MRYSLVISFALVILTSGHAQQNSEKRVYETYKDQWVAHSSLGLNDSPFRLKGSFGTEEVLRYRSNLNAIMGIGVAHKWFALNLSFKLPGYLRNTEDFGKTNYIDLGLQFEHDNWFFVGDIHRYSGFGIKNANNLNNSLPVTNQNVFFNDEISTFSVSAHAYQFFNEQFKMNPALGIVGRYLEETKSFYIKYTTNVFSLRAENEIMPNDFFPHTASIYEARSMGAFDVGAVPGFAYINNIEGWQYGFMTGVGAVIQLKSFSYQNITRAFLGLAPRVDIRAQAGYNVDKWFLMLTSSFDNKSVNFDEFNYRQVYYALSLNYGYRFE
jgi:hypothetical protein